MTVYAVLYTYDDRTTRRDEVRPEHREFLSGLLDGDPFHREGLVIGRTVREWTPVFGPWAG